MKPEVSPDPFFSDRSTHDLLIAEVAESVDEVDACAVDLISERPLHTWGWLKTLEDSDVLDMFPRHIVVKERGDLVAFAPCFLQRSVVFDDLAEELLTRRQYEMLHTARKLGLLDFQMMPCLVAGVPENFSSGISMGPGLAQQRHVLGLIVEALREQARRDDVDVFGFNAVSEREKVLTSVLVEEGYWPCLRNASAVLDIKWGNLKDYLASLSRNGRKSLRRNLRHFDAAGFIHHEITGVDDLKKMSSVLSRLAANVYRVHSNGECPFTPSFYRNLCDNLPGRFTINTAVLNDVVVGFSLDVAHRGCVYGHHWGTDYSEVSRSGKLYFVIGFQIPISRAIQNGSQLIEFGPAAWAEKAVFGCRFERISMYLDTWSRPGRQIFRAFLKRVDRKKRRWLARKTCLVQGSRDDVSEA